MRYHLILCIIAGLLLVACNRQQEAPDTAGQPLAGEEPGTGAANTTVGEPEPTGTQTEEPDQATTPVGDSRSLEELLRGKAQEYTVSYDFESEDGTQEITMLFDSPRMVTEVMVDGAQTRMIFDGDSYIACNQAEEGWTCFKSGSAQTISQNEQFEEQVTEEGTESRYLGPCTVAGEEGMKFEIIGEEDSSTACVTSDGILLEIVTEESSMRATSVSRSVDEGMFTPPVAPIDLTAAMNQ